jgi:[ribosomal protein S18]-alanine N-acetyltransferase
MSRPLILIRSMQMEDIEKVVAIDRLSFSLPWPTSSYRFELLENKTSRLWVSEHIGDGSQGRIVAMIVVWNIVDEAHIATIAVHPEYRRLGIGKHLLAYALKDALQQGMHTATLEVRAGNQAAQAMYRQFGFVTAGIRLRYYQDNQEDALIMTARLENLASWIQATENTMILSQEAHFES